MDNRNDIDIDIDIRSRKKKRVKKRYALKKIKSANIILCVLSFAVVAVCMIVLKRPEISGTENRTLAKFPEFSVSDYFSGKYNEKIENYYNDTVPGREMFKKLTASIRDKFGMQSEKAKIHGTPVKQDVKPAVTSSAAVSDRVSTAPKTAETTVSTTVTTEPDPLDDPDIEGEISNNILVYDNRGIMLFGGSYSNGELYAEYVNRFKEDLGINVYSMVCPTPVSYYLPKKYADMTASEKDNIDNINEHLEGVVPIDAYGVLMEHKSEDIFKKTDHHWAQLGAFYAAEEFARTAKVPFAGLGSYKRIEREGYVGTLYGYTGDSDLYNNPEKFVYYEPTNKYTMTMYDPDMSNEREASLILDIDNLDPVSWYLVFIGTDAAVSHVHTDVGNGRKLAVVKDSYGNALVPCLTGSFEDIYVVDMRYFEVNAISQFKEWGITDLLFAMNTFSATGGNFECIEKIRTQ
ncbi:MAG: DHHW family protein [Clostridium sp.]|nr:DHHW family protein [Clostridium sp.]MCM1546878.1 DHHW family protein [Ruminococcus sp.]